tara:strand:+ start:701 stop:2401 length:1701 start_codon:yes stop_codon:yes gene_type:complete
MKYFFNKNYLIFFFVFILFLSNNAHSKIKYSKEDISNYFIGIVSANQDSVSTAFKHLNNVEYLKNKHTNFNIEFIRTLVLLEKFDEAFTFSKNVWKADQFFFEADILLGLDALLKKDYINAEKHFSRLNSTSRQDLIFENFLRGSLLSWVHASKNEQDNSFMHLNKIPGRYYNLKNIQDSFLHCYFDTSKVLSSFKKLFSEEKYSFSRYNFFLINYLIHKNEKNEAIKVITTSRKKYNQNLLLKQSENFIFKDNETKIKNFFNCKKVEDNIAEIFYIIANLYSTEQNYQLSNFYLKLSFLLNEKFYPNKTLLAENLFYQKKYDLSKKTYKSIKFIGPIYSWHASKSISTILLITDNTEKSISYLDKQFKKIKNPNFEHYYDLANFYKDNEFYKESIEYYSLALKNIKKNHSLVPKILDRRGTSYERIGEWDKAEKDLNESLKILPDQPYVLNYLAYSWIEKKINIDEALEMLTKAMKLKENDGYIIDSLGWAYFATKNYINAEKYLRRAVELMPMDPVINDHYADALWMLKKNIQARYFWKHVLSLDKTEEELRENINNKLIFGIN